MTTRIDTSDCLTCDACAQPSCAQRFISHPDGTSTALCGQCFRDYRAYLLAWALPAIWTSRQRQYRRDARPLTGVRA